MLIAKKLLARIPRTRLFTRVNQQRWQLNATIGHEAHQFWETFFERSAPPFWIPDEMTDPKRREILACIPCGQSCDRSVRFVLPNSLSNSERVIVRTCDRRRIMRDDDRHYGGDRCQNTEPVLLVAVLCYL